MKVDRWIDGQIFQVSIRVENFYLVAAAQMWGARLKELGERERERQAVPTQPADS